MNVCKSRENSCWETGDHPKKLYWQFIFAPHVRAGEIREFLNIRPGTKVYPKIWRKSCAVGDIKQIDTMPAVIAALYILRTTQNLLHLPAFCQFIHQFVQIPDLLRQRVTDILYTVPTDYSGN